MGVYSYPQEELKEKMERFRDRVNWAEEIRRFIGSHRTVTMDMFCQGDCKCCTGYP